MDKGPLTDFRHRAEAAADAVHSLFDPTPLQRNDHLSAEYGAEIWLKREDLTPVRSYKLRGAFNAMRKVRSANPGQGHFVCASAGNHAQGVAYACRHFGVKGTIFMPVTTPQQKIAKTRTFGGDAIEIRLTGDYFDDTLRAAQDFCAKEGAHFLSPFDDADVIEGQAGVAVEMLAQLGRAPDVLVVPVGGGGLSAGMTAYLHAVGATTEVVYVEPVGAPSLAAALAVGAPQTLPRIDSFVDGAAVARIGARPFDVLRSVHPRDVMTVSEDRLCTTILSMLNVEGIVLEPAGALSVDALKDLKDRIAGRTVVCVTTGGNFDFERLPEVKERSQRAAGLKKYFILRLPQRPGALRDFLLTLGPDDDIARFEYLKKSNRNFGSVLLGIETTDPANFPMLFARMEAGGFAYRDITADEVLAEFLV
jgi:threonine dehydratase